MNVNKIVTARNTTFSLKAPKDGAQDSPVVTKIEFLMGDTADTSTYGVTYSDGAWVEIKDAVEIWHKE